MPVVTVHSHSAGFRLCVFSSEITKIHVQLKNLDIPTVAKLSVCDTADVTVTVVYAFAAAHLSSLLLFFIRGKVDGTERQGPCLL